MATAYIGISGYVYGHWRGGFYPQGVPQRRWLSYAAERFNSIELNTTFYSLKWPSVYERWRIEVPQQNFVFAIKGSRFITHRLRLRNIEQAMANFLGSGVLALGHATGPFLWQLPPSDKFDPVRLETFLAYLPKTSEQAADIAKEHDDRLKRGALTEPRVAMPYRHAIEVRNESYNCEPFFDLLRRYGCSFVLADTAGRFMFAEQVTADFVYVRLHGSQQLYVSRYTDEELEWWAAHIKRWMARGHDVYVYFDNDAHGHAPYDALRLEALVNEPIGPPSE